MGVSKKNLKATKKFEKQHLKGVLDKRKAVAKIKQRQQIKDKKQSRRTQDSEFFKGKTENGTATPDKAPNGVKGKKSGEMSVDDFFQGGFDEIIDTKGSKSGKLGKRKRGDAKDAKEDLSDESGSGVDINEQPAASDGEDDDDDDDDDDEAGGMSKDTMDKLAEKDPEFYK
jgi:nucleolar complex protein 2